MGMRVVAVAPRWDPIKGPIYHLALRNFGDVGFNPESGESFGLRQKHPALGSPLSWSMVQWSVVRSPFLILRSSFSVQKSPAIPPEKSCLR